MKLLALFIFVSLQPAIFASPVPGSFRDQHDAKLVGSTPKWRYGVKPGSGSPMVVNDAWSTHPRLRKPQPKKVINVPGQNKMEKRDDSEKFSEETEGKKLEQRNWPINEERCGLKCGPLQKVPDDDQEKQNIKVNIRTYVDDLIPVRPSLKTLHSRAPKTDPCDGFIQLKKDTRKKPDFEPSSVFVGPSAPFSGDVKAKAEAEERRRLCKAREAAKQDGKGQGQPNLTETPLAPALKPFMRIPAEKLDRDRPFETAPGTGGREKENGTQN